MKLYVASLFNLILLLGCSPSMTNKHNKKGRSIEAAGSKADFLQMTRDHEGNVIAWWAETDSDTQEPVVCWSRSPKKELNFEEKQCIGATRRASLHAEGLPELVVKTNGTYVLVFGRRNVQAENQWASSILYIQSFDKGKTWTEPEPVHSDDNIENSHAFSTAVLLPNGEVGAVWLDTRNQLDHSEVFFARTHEDEGFGQDKQIGGPSCECCKLSLYVDGTEDLHLVYRSLTKNNIRDISHIVSRDNGKTFSTPSVVYNDEWQINACPHNGPDIAASGDHLFVIWYTAGGEEGLYYARSDGNGGFPTRNRLTKQAKRAYIASLNNHVLAVWDEIFQREDQSYRRVQMGRINQDGELVETHYLSPKGVKASMPSLLKMNGGSVIASWTQRTEEENQLYFQKYTK